MRQITTALILGAFAILIYTAASANSPAPPSFPITAIGDDSTRLVADPKSHTVSIVIEGREVARFDADGLHVTGNLDYSGTTTDTSGSQPHVP